MRALVTSAYSDMEGTHITTVAMESEFVDTLESVRYQMRIPGVLVVSEIIEAGAEDLPDVAMQAVMGLDPNAGRHQATLYYWSVQEWDMLRPGGSLLMDRPAPLTREQMADVFEQLAEHPDYKNYSIIGFTRDHELVVLEGGKVKGIEEL